MFRHFSRAYRTVSNATPFLSIFSEVTLFAGGLAYLNHRLDQKEKMKLQKENPGCLIEKTRVKEGFSKSWGRYSIYQWTVKKPESESKKFEKKK